MLRFFDLCQVVLFVMQDLLDGIQPFRSNFTRRSLRERWWGCSSYTPNSCRLPRARKDSRIASTLVGAFCPRTLRSTRLGRQIACPSIPSTSGGHDVVCVPLRSIAFEMRLKLHHCLDNVVLIELRARGFTGDKIRGEVNVTKGQVHWQFRVRTSG